MRILVASDTHHDFHALKRAVECQPSAEIVIHLGDGADDAEDVKYLFPQKMFLQVRGNCDWGSVLPYQGEYILNKWPHLSGKIWIGDLHRRCPRPSRRYCAVRPYARSHDRLPRRPLPDESRLAQRLGRHLWHFGHHPRRNRHKYPKIALIFGTANIDTSFNQW